MDSKKCFRCGEIKLLGEFYKLKKMRDGYLNKCKQCSKDDSRKRYYDIKSDPIKSFKERSRQAQKEKKRRISGVAIKSVAITKPSQIKQNACAAAWSHIKAVEEGFERHHWSYNKDHWIDVFIMSTRDHNIIHRYMRYDVNSLMYRRLDGTLIDSRDSASTYYEYVLGLNYGEYPLDYPSSVALTELLL